MEGDKRKLIKSLYDDEPSSLSPMVVVPRDPEPSEFGKIAEHVHKEMALSEIIHDELSLIQYGLDQESLDLRAPPGTSWEWELYQRQYFEYSILNEYLGYWYCSNKCRQSGISAAFSIKMLARATLTARDFEGVFVSYKKDEAINKIKYVKDFLAAMPVTFRKKIIRDPLQLIEWENSNGTRSKIFSHAQKEIRGTPASVIVLDELAFYNFAEEIYVSATPALGQTRGILEVTSTPFGKGGVFYELFTDHVKFNNFYREMIYWWYCKRYLRPQYQDPESFVNTMLDAEELPTEERVYKYGNEQIIKLLQNSDLESFQQEFEGHFVDNQASFFPKDLIYSILYKEAEDNNALYNPKDNDFKDLVTGAMMSPEEALADLIPAIQRHENYESVKFKRFNTLQDLYFAVKSGEITNNLVAGADIGSTANSTEIVILEEIKLRNGLTVQIERFDMSLAAMPLPDQIPYFKEILDTGIIKKMNIDSTGMGQYTAEELKRYFPSVVHGFHFASGGIDKKEKIYKNLKARMETGCIALFDNRRTVEHLYSIKREISETGKPQYKAEERKKHHADKAVAIALASYAGTHYGDHSGIRPSSSKTYSRESAQIASHIPEPEFSDIPGRKGSVRSLGSNRRGKLKSLRNIRKHTPSGLDPFIPH